MSGEKDVWKIYKDNDNRWRWKRIAPNGRVVAESNKSFQYKDNCEENAVRNGYRK